MEGPRGRPRWVRVAAWTLGGLTVMGAGLVGSYLATLYRAGPPQEGYLALTGARALVGPELESREHVTVLIHNGVIVEIGADGDVAVPSEAATIDLGGSTLLPGLVDLHVHLGSPAMDGPPGLLDWPGLVADWARFAPGRRRALLEHGVTSVRSVGDDHSWILDVRRMIADGTLEGPRVFAAGPLFTTLGGHPVVTMGGGVTDGVRVPTTADEARRAVRELASDQEAVDLIKVVQERGSPDRPLEPIAPGVLEAIVTEAHAQGLPVTAHWGTLEDLDELLDAGVDALEHLDSRDLLAGWPEDQLAELLARDVPITATLTVSAVSLLDEPIMAQLRSRVGEFHDAGGRVVVGSDAGMPGVPFGAAVHEELEQLVASGLSPAEALMGATSRAAAVLGSDEIGIIEPGRAADLLIVDGDPDEDIPAVRNVITVIRDGRVVIDRRDGP